MRPVRIVTLVAVSVGGAMGAGWMFQPEPGPQTAQIASPELAAAVADASTRTSLLAEIATPAAELPVEPPPNPLPRPRPPRPRFRPTPPRSPR